MTKGLRMVAGEFCCVNSSGAWTGGPVLRPWHSSYCSGELLCFLLLILPIPILLTMARVSFCCLPLMKLDDTNRVRTGGNEETGENRSKDGKEE